MAATEAIPPPIALPTTPDPASVIAVSDDEHPDSNDKASPPTQSTPNGQAGQTTRLPYVYTRPQMLYLQKSPLVAPPANIPPLKDWFGDWHEQQSNNKKDTEGTAHTNGGRERRPRREAEDGGNSQFSQMGNFKHQPIRDREARERERDLRDKDAQDKLRSLSDKYDRDRLSLGSASGLRGKERELAPHLQGTSLRNGSSTNGSAGRGERREPREAGKRRVGETDDWRRGDRGRDDRKDDRDDREDRDRPKSRARNASRAPRDASSRRDRDKSRIRDDRDDDRDRRRGERDDRRRDRDDGPKRAREGDREEDGRHWRDDGRRDERQAARRGDRDRGWERGDRDQDRERWGRGDRARDDDPPNRNRGGDKDKDRWDDDREARPKRGERGGRERRGAGGADDPRDKEDRKDKDKDKAPAWMETYVPTGSGGGILGGKGDDGALDELQAWKKTMKERELAAQNANKPTAVSDVPAAAKVTDIKSKASEGSTLDEIQQFKLIMKQAQSTPPNEHDSTPTTTSGPPPSSVTSKPANESKNNMSTALSNTPPVILASSSTSSADVGSNPSTGSIPSSSVASDATSATSSGSHPLLAMLKSGSAELDMPTTSDHNPSSYSYAQHDARPAVSRLFPTTPATEEPPSYGGSFGGSMNTSAPVSRLVGPARGNAPPVASNKAFGPGGNTHTPPILDNGLAGGAGRLTPGSQGLQHLPDDFAQLGIGNQDRGGLDQLRSQMGLTSPPSQFDGVGRGSNLGAFSPPYEQRMFGGVSTASQVHDHGSVMGNPGLEQVPQAMGRGSRFAKLFDNDGRRGPTVNGMMGANDPGAFNVGGGMRQDIDLGHFGGNDNRADLLAMMNNMPQQMSRGSSGYSGHQNPSPGPQYPGGFTNQHVLQQQLQQQRLPPTSRHEQGLQNINLGRDERNFHPDLIAPGLRNVTPGGRREIYADQFEDPAVFANQRLPPPGRVIDHMHPGLQQHLPQGGRTHASMHVQPNMYGRGPSPQQLNNAQRLPTNLAHLGSRPPHDPGQFVGLPGHQQQPLYNNSLGGPGAGGFGGHPQMRGAPQHMLGGQSGMDMRGGQGPMLGGLGPGAGGGSMNMGSARGLGSYGMQPSHAVGMQGGNIPVAGRPPQPPFSSQMGGGIMPPQMQQGQNVNVQSDLMSLLIGRRE